MHPGSHVILNGDLVRREEARIGVDDLGFLVGDGVFETLRLYEGVPFLLQEHLSRIFRSLKSVALDISWTREQLTDMVSQVVQRNALQSGPGRLRITLTRGPGIPPLRSRNHPTLLILADPYQTPEPSLYETGVEVEISHHVRHASVWRNVKSTSYQPNLQLRREASHARVFEVLQWNDQGGLTEGSFTNVFLVDANGVLRTPAPREGCLEGMTRNAVLAIAEQTNLDYLEGGITQPTLAGARELFLTGSLIEIMPVSRIQGREIGHSCPGTVTKSLHQAYRDLVASSVRSDQGAR